MRKSVLITVVTGMYLLLFTYTAVSKLLNYETFLFQLQLSPLPYLNQLAPAVAAIVPLMEAICCLGLLIGSWRLKALMAAVVLMVFFEGYIAAMLITGSELPCTCGGIISTMGWEGHLFFNAGFIALGIIAVLSARPCTRKKSKSDIKTFYA